MTTSTRHLCPHIAGSRQDQCKCQRAQFFHLKVLFEKFKFRETNNPAHNLMTPTRIIHKNQMDAML